MQVRPIARWFGVVAATTTLVSGIALGGTSASAMSVGAPGVLLATSTIGGHNVEAPLSYEVTPFVNGALVTWNCKAFASPDPASTGIGTCSVAGKQSVPSPNNMPGAFSVAVGTVFVADGTQPEACVEGHATFLENVIGPLNVSTGERCRNLNLITVPLGVV